ncbi:MAG: hypothetical protein ACXW0J_05355 [Nitrososphaeraceae archaeon]
MKNNVYKAIIDRVNHIYRLSFSKPITQRSYADCVTYYYEATKRTGLIADFDFELQTNFTLTNSKEAREIYLSQIISCLHNFELFTLDLDNLNLKLKNLKDVGLLVKYLNDTDEGFDRWSQVIKSESTIIDYLEFEGSSAEVASFKKELIKHTYNSFITAAIKYPLELFDKINTNISINSQSISNQGYSKHTEKITWNCSIQELAELFVQLDSKGFISLDKSGSLNAYTRSIEALFDFSHRKKTVDGLSQTSTLYNYFNTKATYKEFEYESDTEQKMKKKYIKIFTKRYVPLFDCIPTLGSNQE